MPQYQVEFLKSSQKDFDRLLSKIQDIILESLSILLNNPFSEILKYKKIKGSDSLYRIRVGDYRVVYEVKNDILLIVVIKLGHRKDVYRYL